MANGKRITDIQNYVESVCKAFFTAREDIKDIEYKYQGITHKSYIKVTTAYGISVYFDATDLECGDICMMLSAMMLNRENRRRIKNFDVIKKVEKLFGK